MEGEKLTLCLAQPGEPEDKCPKEFVTGDENGILMVLERSKDAK